MIYGTHFLNVKVKIRAHFLEVRQRDLSGC